MQEQRMREQNVAGFAGHLDYAQLDVVRHFAAFLESLDPPGGAVPRTEISDPRTFANERVACVRRLKFLDSFAFTEAFHQPMRPFDEKRAAGSWSQRGETYKQTHQEESSMLALGRKIQMPTLIRQVPGLAGLRKGDQ